MLASIIECRQHPTRDYIPMLPAVTCTQQILMNIHQTKLTCYQGIQRGMRMTKTSPMQVKSAAHYSAR